MLMYSAAPLPVALSVRSALGFVILTLVAHTRKLSDLVGRLT